MGPRRAGHRASSRELVVFRIALEVAPGGLLGNGITWTLAGPIKPGNGNSTDPGWLGAKDLNSQHHVKRIHSR
jgi:hypothetical protein